MTMDVRLVVPAVLAWAVAWWLTGAPDLAVPTRAVLWACVVAVAVVVAVVAYSERTAHRARSRSVFRPVPRRSAVVAVAGVALVGCAAAALMASLVASAAPGRLPADVERIAAAHSPVEARIAVGSGASRSASLSGFGGLDAGSGRIRFTGTLLSVVPAHGRTAAEARISTDGLSVPVVVFAAAEPGQAPGPAPGSGSRRSVLRIGAIVDLTATLTTTDAGDAASLLVFGDEVPSPVAAPPWWLDWADELRARFAAAAASLPGDGGALLPGLAIGDTSAVGDDLDAAMKMSSLSHLTAVSGDTVAKGGGFQIATHMRYFGQYRADGRCSRE
jgi:competence protein ComEC